LEAHLKIFLKTSSRLEENYTYYEKDESLGVLSYKVLKSFIQSKTSIQGA